MSRWVHVRQQTGEEREGEFVQVKWGASAQGEQGQPLVAMSVVAQELGNGQRHNKLFAGAPSLSSVKNAMHRGHGKDESKNRNALHPMSSHTL